MLTPSKTPPVSTPPVRTSLVAPEVAGVFEEIELTFDAGVTQLKHSGENSYVQLVMLCASTFLFMLFVVSVVPMMKLTAWGNVLWVGVGVVALVVVGLVSQARLRMTTLRLGEAGVDVEQGTLIDREHATLAWGELAGVTLEPVDPKDAGKGMQLHLAPRDADPVDVFAGLGLGDLNAARREVLAEWEARRPAAARA